MLEVQAWDAKKVRSKSESVRRMENRSRREFDGPLSLEERRSCITPPEITWGELCCDNVKDEEGYRACSKSKVLPGMDGETSDAISAYTQVKMTGAPRLLRLQQE